MFSGPRSKSAKPASHAHSDGISLRKKQGLDVESREAKMGKLEAKSARAERSIAGRANVFVLLLGATQCIPAQATKTWAVFPGDYGKNDDPASGSEVLVLGDSLVAGINQVRPFKRARDSAQYAK
jgi:hypothetical protein